LTANVGAVVLDPSQSIHTHIEQERKRLFPEASMLEVFRRYVRGRQNATYTPDQFNALRGVAGNRHCDNVCTKIVEETADRLELVRYNVANEGVLEFLQDLFVKNQMPDLSDNVHFDTLRDGNFALSLNWDAEAGRVTLHEEDWWDGKSGIYVAYDDSKRAIYAVKDWETIERRKRRVIWRPDRIERYLQDGDGWKPFQLPEDQGQWPVPWVRGDGKPLGIPVVHFANRRLTSMPYGDSTLDGGVLGLQDEINDMQRNITLAARFTGAQMYSATGVAAEKDDQGRTKRITIGPGVVLQAEDPQAKFTAIPAGDLAQLEKSYMLKLQAVARMTNTPIHLITGNWPSGEALLQANAPLVKKVERLAKTIGPAWASLAHIATEMANTFGRAGLDENALITSVFSPADKRDPLTQSQIASTRKEMVSNKETLRIMGYSPEQIDQIEKERREEATQAQLASAADTVPQLPEGRVQ
jgi:hypothetical protein